MAEQDAEPRVAGANPARRGGSRGLRPRAVDAGQEVLPRRTGLVQLPVAAVAVVADRRGADEDARGVGQPGEGAGEESRSLHSALHDGALVGSGPPLGDSLAGKVDDGVEPVESVVVDLAG